MNMAKMIEMKCPSCGGQMKLHNEKKRILKCPYCECQVMLSTSVNKHYTLNKTKVSAKNVIMAGKETPADLWNKVNKYIKLQNRELAVRTLYEIIKLEPTDVNAYKKILLIKECAFDQGEIIGEIIAGKELGAIVDRYAHECFPTELESIHRLKGENSVKQSIQKSFLHRQIEAIHAHISSHIDNTLTWDNLPTGYFFQLIDSQKRFSIESWSKSECRKFNDYIKNAYQDDYNLDEITSFMLLKDKQTVVFKARSSDGDYTSFLVFRVNGRSLNAPSYFVSGDFKFKPSVFNKKYEFHRIGAPKSRKHPCNISLSRFHDGDVYALTFDDNKTVYFAKTESAFEETRNTIKWGWGHNGIPFTFDPW